ncbi:DUF6090 family protein [Ichthyenterobacterium sp. W332]|uniref:DUF6090 family protein n=1 Tax=Microcosmobacter mediterraneus TaxID=3075607 RepID=A0ABU2YIV3_9FLAO|nr:DUF6090 family protein [Ichthyenterobacterium sp. W332]MDT0558097.1 DUF6090 family protein [Ichthyenterobacterium sp. W332]
MIKFFNKTRKQMLKENKIGRYLKYAIGEIILVMIGILLALQVNTWNTNRELKKEEAKILKSLHQEFSKNLDKFNIIYNNHLKRKKTIEYVMSAETQKLSADSLATLMNRINSNWTYDPFQGIYNSVIGSGKIELISNDSLKTKLATIQDLIKDYQEEEREVREFSKQNLYPFLLEQPLKNFKFNSKDILESKKVKNNYIKIFKSFEYDKLMQQLRGWMRSIFDEGPIFRKELVSIINLLEEEIEKHN